MSHSYTNPSKKQDLAHLEANVEEGVDEHGFSKRKPISDRECIYKCLDNNRALAGLDRKQVERLAKQFETMSDDTKVESEYPPL
jgi:hypothetical protein